MTQQPKWKRIANLGDVSPVDYGGYFVYRDLTGVYPAEGELLLAPDSDDSGEGWTMYRFTLDRCKLVETEEHKVYLVPERYDSTWPYPVSHYNEWFHKYLAEVAKCCDYASIREDLCSADPIKLAHAYRAIGEYHGLENLDSYPEKYAKRSELPRRWRRYNGRR